MCSITYKIENHKKRFIVEFYQLEDRIIKLKSMIEKFYKNELDFTPSTPIKLLEAQLKYMESYAELLLVRSFIEQIIVYTSLSEILTKAADTYRKLNEQLNGQQSN